MTMEDVSGDGKVTVERERLTILQMVGEIEEDMSLNTGSCMIISQTMTVWANIAIASK